MDLSIRRQRLCDSFASQVTFEEIEEKFRILGEEGEFTELQERLLTKYYGFLRNSTLDMGELSLEEGVTIPAIRAAIRLALKKLSRHKVIILTST